MENIDIYKKEWSGKYKNIKFSICFWKNNFMKKPKNISIYPNRGIWNSYIIIFKKMILKEFDNLIPKFKTYRKKKSRDYYSLENYFNMSGGITLFETIYNEEGINIGFKVGNDYNHIWNGEETLELIFEDVKNSIEQFISNFPKYKVWSYVNGKWIVAKNIEIYNKKTHQKIINK